MQPFCRTVTPTSSLLADSRRSVIAVNILISSKSGLDSSKEKKQIMFDIWHIAHGSMSMSVQTWL